jgi:hypothetical protein
MVSGPLSRREGESNRFGVDNTVDNSGRPARPGRSLRCSFVTIRRMERSNEMFNRIHDMFDELERNSVMLSFKGSLSNDLITALLDHVELKMQTLEPDSKARKRIFNVVTECLQNLHRHNAHMKLTHEGAEGTEEPHGVLMITHEPDGYSVVTGNFMAAEDVTNLKAHLDRINDMTPEQLREFYKETLADGQYTKRGGGGLGMIDIARKSGKKLEYGFVPYDENNSFFSFNVKVTP